MRSARELTASDWILSSMSLPMGTPFDERLDAAANAGFQGFGLLVFEYQALVASGRSPAELKEAVESRGLVLAEIEALMNWTGVDHTAADAALETACEMADVFGARHFQAIGPYEGSIDDAGAAFARVCDRAAESDLRVAIEFFSSNNISDARVALEIVERANRPNGGICLDIWHHVRGANDESLLRAIPAERVVSVQLSDGAIEPVEANYMKDTMENRLAPGEGEFDIPRFLALLDEIGCRAPRSIEVLSKAYQESMSVAQIAERLAKGARGLPAPAN